MIPLVYADRKIILTMEDLQNRITLAVQEINNRPLEIQAAIRKEWKRRVIKCAVNGSQVE